MINHTTEKLRTQCEMFQKSLFLFIFYIFYNVDLIEWNIDFLLSIIVSRFINDAAIITMNVTTKNNLIILQIGDKRCVKWFKIHESSFVMIKYELIHFRRLFFFIRFKNNAEIFRSRFSFVVKMQVFWNDHEFAIYLKTSFQTFWKKNIRQIQHFNRFNRLNLKNEHRKFEKKLFRHDAVSIHFLRFDVICFPWRARLQAKKNAIFIFMKSIQTRTTKIISKIFYNTAKTALDIEFHLLSIQNQMNIVFYDTMLKIIISSIYSHIRVQKILSNRQLLFEQIQHQKNFYVQFSFFHKLKTRYAAVFKKNFNRLKIKNFFSMISWMISFKIIIVKSAKKTIKIHDAIKIQRTSLVIYTNDSDIEKNVKTLTMTIFISVDDQISIVINKKQIYLRLFIEHIIYSNELIKLNLTLNIVKAHFKNTMMNIFIDNQLIIKIIKFFKQ